MMFTAESGKFHLIYDNARHRTLPQIDSHILHFTQSV